MLLVGQPRALQRLQIMVRRSEPMQGDRRRQRVLRHPLAITECIALALHDQRRRPQPLQMGHSRLVRLPRGMERIAQAHQCLGLQLIG